MVSSQHIAPVRLVNIQALRGLAALMVVITHLPTMEAKHAGDALLPPSVMLGISGVDLFFVISGFIMVYVTWQSQNSLRKAGEFLFARASRIYPIYWIVALALLGVWLVKPGLLSFDPEQTSLLKSFALWPDDTMPMLKVAWTLIHEMYFYLVFTLIILFAHKWRLLLLALWMGLVIIGNLAGLSTLRPEAALIFHPLSMEFFMGAVAAWLFLSGYKFSGGVMAALGILGWLAAILYLVTLPDLYFPMGWDRIVLFGLPATLLTYGVACLEFKGRILPKWSEIFGNWSYSLYLTHVLAFSVIGYIWRPFARGGMIDNIIMLPILVIGAICVGAATYYTFERTFIRAAKALRRKWFKAVAK